MFLKKLLNIAVCSAVLGMTACGSISAADSRADDGRLSVVCTAFSCYDWTKEILGSHAEDISLTYLLENGADMHTYMPSAADIARISDCDVFIYVGGESELWAEDAIKEADNKDMTVIKLLDTEGLDAKEETVKEGMQENEESEHDIHSQAPECDEHIWLSLKNAQVLCSEIADKLSDADPENADDYRSNCEAYKLKLGELDEKYADTVDHAKNKTLIFGDRFPFRYLCDDYGLDYYAAFTGCSAETEASFETVAFLAEKTDELGVGTVLTIENSDGRIAQAIISSSENKDRKTAELDSLQSVNADSIGSGTTYISLMEKNCDVLKEAIS